MSALYSTIFALLLLTAAEGAAAASFSHADWGTVLQRFVDEEGFVDYGALAEDRAALDRYIAALTTSGPELTPALFANEEEKLAYYLNAYNALVFKGVLDRWPDIKSVWGLGTGFGFFVATRYDIDGQTLSLKKLEDDVIRAGFKDPRIHAALNCASISCPRLPREPFVGAKLDEQLDAAMGAFVNEPRNCKLDAESKTVTLSKIFDWFDSDFTDFEKAQAGSGGTVIDYVNRYRPADAKIPANYEVAFFDYDKGLNKQE